MKAGIVLDACCDSRMFWFNKTDSRAVFVDKRKEAHVLCDGRSLEIAPDVVADFTALPFPDESFYVVIFDPPHMTSLGENSWLARKYGRLFGDWRHEIAEGFAECFRVLRPLGTLIFKWNETDVPLGEILSLTNERPLVGNRCGKQSRSHWIVFLKEKQDNADVT